MITNCDGIVEKLYHLLWQHDVVGDKVSCDLQIPDTVLIRKGVPTFWYFTDKNGKIMRKNTKKVKLETVYSSFVKKVGSSGIVAYFLYNVDNEGNSVDEVGELIFGPERGSSQRRISKIVYFDAEKLSTISFSTFVQKQMENRKVFGRWSIPNWLRSSSEVHRAIGTRKRAD